VTKTICFIMCGLILLSAMPAHAKDIYDRHGRRVGSQDGNKFYDSSGRLEYTRDRDRDKDTYYDRSGRRQWTIDRDDRHDDDDD
jgi:hypothetical protein